MSKKLEIKKSVAVALLAKLGFPGAEKWDSFRIAQRLKKLPSAVEGDEDVGKDFKAVFTAVVKTAEAGGEITVIDEDTKATPAPAKASKKAPAPVAEESEEEESEEEESEEEESEEEAPKAKAKASKKAPVAEDEEESEEEAPKAKSKASKPKGDAGGKDKFGCRLGSQAATINAVITKKPQTADEIATASETAPARVRAHMKAFIEKKFFVNVPGKGYKLV